MQVAFLNLIGDSKCNEPQVYMKSTKLPHKLYKELGTAHQTKISVIQRASFNATTTVEEITYYFVSDEFKPSLRWWQEPVPAFQLLSEIQPGVVHVSGLNLPLQFRWIRRLVGDEIILIGEHTGETIWASRNLWLQQFGLRVVDGFIFQDLMDAHPWTKASVILEKQPIVEISRPTKDPKATAKSLINFYNELLTTKDTL
jgi:hypothetical protein